MRGLVISTLLAALAAVAGSFLYSRFQLIGAYGLRDGTIPALHAAAVMSPRRVCAPYSPQVRTCDRASQMQGKQR